MIPMGELSVLSELQEWLATERELIAEMECLNAEIAATETLVEHREETEFYMRTVKRDATIRRLM